MAEPFHEQDGTREEFEEATQQLLPRRAQFLNLPTEIRIQIYHYLLKNEDKISPAAYTHRDGIGLLRVNKAISQEAQFYLYSANTFALHIPSHRAWINHIGRKNSNSIRHLSVIVATNPHNISTHLVSLQNTIKSRCFEGLRTIEYEFQQQLQLPTRDLLDILTSSKIQSSWHRFQNLQMIALTVPAGNATTDDEALLRRLAKQAKVSQVVGRFLERRPGGARVTSKWLEISSK